MYIRDWHTSLGDVGNIVILEVEDSLGVLNDGTGVRCDKELNGLGHAVLRHEGTRLGSSELGTGGGLAGSVTGRDSQETAGNLLLLDYRLAKYYWAGLTSLLVIV
jgi:hypothetical protein